MSDEALKTPAPAKRTSKRAPKRPAGPRAIDVVELPTRVRDAIGRRLRAGWTTEAILRDLGESACGLELAALEQWNGTGYQAWAREQERLEAMRTRRENAMRLARESQETPSTEEMLERAAADIYDLLTELDPLTLKEKVLEDPSLYLRLLALLVRLSEGRLKQERQEADTSASGAGSKGGGGLASQTLLEMEEALKLL